MSKGPEIAKVLGRGKGELFWPDIKTYQVIVIRQCGLGMWVEQ